MEFLHAVENTAFATWVRESPSLLAYPTVLFLHTLGLGLLVGFNTAIDLRILGVARHVPLKAIEKFFPVMFLGFWISALSGAALLAADASTMIPHPVFILKLVLIALAVVDIQALKGQVFRQPSVDKLPITKMGRVLAAVSLLLWVGAITAGRLTAYLVSKGI